MLGIKPGSQHSCLSDDTLKPVGPFYIVSIAGEVTCPTRRVGGGKYVTSRGFHIQALYLEKGNYINHSCVSPNNGLFGVYKTKNVSAD